MAYQSVSEVTLYKAERAYAEHTLIAFDDARYFNRSTAVTMARYIDPQSRQPEWGHYAILKERTSYPQEDELLESSYPPVWVDVDPDDPMTKNPDSEGRYRGLWFHKFSA